jgi:hypothetical protein
MFTVSYAVRFHHLIKLTRLDPTCIQVTVEGLMGVRQGCINPGRQVAQATKYCTVVPNICGSSVSNLLRQPSGTYNFEFATRGLENLCTREINCVRRFKMQNVTASGTYRVIQEETSIFGRVILPVTIRKKNSYEHSV